MDIREPSYFLEGANQALEDELGVILLDRSTQRLESRCASTSFCSYPNSCCVVTAFNFYLLYPPA